MQLPARAHYANALLPPSKLISPLSSSTLCPLIREASFPPRNCQTTYLPFQLLPALEEAAVGGDLGLAAAVGTAVETAVGTAVVGDQGEGGHLQAVQHAARAWLQVEKLQRKSNKDD